MRDPYVTAAPLDQPAGSSPWVLVVEDDADLRSLVTLSVGEVTGLEAKAAADGAEALQLMRDDRPSVVITDLMMPGTDGFQLLEETRGSDPSIPFVAMSAAESRTKAMGAGFDAYLVKPFELEELCAVLARWVSVVD